MNEEQTKDLVSFIKERSGYGNVLAFTILINLAYEMVQQGFDRSAIEIRISQICKPI